MIKDPYSHVATPSFSTTKDEYLEFWAKYMEKTFAHKPIPTFKPPKDYIYSKEQDGPLIKEEVMLAITMLKNLKAAGVDEITNEDIKFIENLKPGIILGTLQKIWMEETCPDNFRQALIHLFPKPQKPGKSKDYRYQKNHRPISLLCTIRKLLEAILSRRILNSVRLQKSQFGFLPGRSTVDCIFILREAILEARYIRRGKKVDAT